MLTYFGLNLFLLAETNSPVLLKTLSDRTDVAKITSSVKFF